MEYIKSVLWNFGDGRTSTEYNPKHTYAMPGKYLWRLTVTDLFGREVKSYGYIYVTEWDYINDTLHATYTDKCYRFALKPSQGVGAVEWSGDEWLWPAAYGGTCKALDDSGTTIALVLNNANGRYYRVGVRDQWFDRLDSYGGSNIECSFKLKEITAVAGEYQELEHIESHVHMRPFWESNRSQNGYDSSGFLEDYALNLQIYADGEQTTPEAQLQEVPRYGDYIYRKRVEARRLQLEISIDTSGWRCIKAQQMFMPLDKVAGPALDYPSESGWQAEFSQPVLWFSRDDSNPDLNRATGSDFSGAHDTRGIGPDGYTNSALNFAPGQGLYASSVSYLTDDFTFGIWVGNISSMPVTLWRMDVDNGATLTVKLVMSGASYAVEWNDGTNGDLRTLSFSGTGWVHLAVQRTNGTLKVFENGVSLSATPLTDSTLGYGGTVYFAENSTCTIFDARINSRAISSAALLYYNSDVTDNQGNGGLLPVRR